MVPVLMEQAPVQADVVTLVIFAVGIALSFAAAMIFRPKVNAERPKADMPATALTNRGAYVPLVIGRRRTSFVFAWAGNRTSKEEGGGSSGKGGSGDIPGQQVYYEQGWHLICVGPATKLWAIKQDGRTLFPNKNAPDPINSTTTPSGSTIDLGKQGAFIIYWGEVDQPLAPTPLSAAMGVASSWPHVCYIFWQKKRLGYSPNWGNLEYEIETRAIGDGNIEDSAEWLSDADAEGVNPAWAAYQLISATYPHGCAVCPDVIDRESLEAWGVMMQWEHLPVNIVAADGEDAGDTLADIMADTGVLFPQIGRFLVTVPIRAVDDVPLLEEDVLVPPRQTVEILHGPRAVDRVVYAFADRSNNFRTMTIAIDDDAQAEAEGTSRATKNIALNAITDYSVAARVVDRRQMEIFAGTAKYTIKAGRGARLLASGIPFQVAGVGQLRVASIEIKDDTPEVMIEAIVDQYAPAVSGFIPPPPPPPPVPGDVEEDLAVLAVEIPAALAAGVASLAVARIRANDETVGAVVLISLDGTSYTSLQEQNPPAAGGSLLDSLPAGGPIVLEDGPRFTPVGPDIADVTDLTAVPNTWLSGWQLALIGSEFFFVRNITAEGGGAYRLNGLARARYDTDAEAHAIGAKVFIVPASMITPMPSGLLQPGVHLWVKVVPFGSSEAMDMSDVTAIELDLVGRANRPLPIDNLNANGWRNVYAGGEPVTIDWTYRVLNGGAGYGPSGIPVAQPKPPHVGTFRVEILAVGGSVVLRTQTIDSDTAQFVYTTANRTADFGGAEPSGFDVRVCNVSGSLAGVARRITVLRRS